MRSLDSILDDKPSMREELPDTAEVEPVEKVASEKPETEKPEPKEAKTETAKAPEAHEDEDQEAIPDDLTGLKKALAAARGDKRKARKQWQETEKALAELRGKLSVMERPAQAQPQKPTVDLTDEEFFAKGPSSVKAYVEQRLSAIRDEQREARLNHSEAAARERHEDFAEVFDDFKRFAQSQPHLWHQMEAAHDPGEFVYRTGKTFKELQGVNNIDDLRKKIRAEIEAEQAATKSAPPAPAPPKSIASARGTGSAATQTWAGPRSIDEILG